MSSSKPPRSPRSPARRRLEAAILDSDGIDALKPPSFLVDELIPHDGLVLMTGLPGSFKSFISLSLGLAVALGEKWHGHTVSQCPVLYVAAEGATGLGARKRAWEAYHSLRSTAFGLLPEPVNLLDAEMSIALADLVRAHGYGLVIIDTLNRSMPGGDENGSRDMGLVLEAVERIRRDSGSTVLLVHHPTKNGVGARGHSSLLGAASTSLLVRKVGNGVELKCEKQKDAEEFAPIQLQMLKEGDSLVLSDRTTRTTPTLSANQKAVLGQIRRSAKRRPASAPGLMKASGLPRSSFYDALKALVATGLVEASGAGTKKTYALAQQGQP